MSVVSPVRTVVRRRRRSVARQPTITAEAVAALNASRDDPAWAQDLRRASFAAWERLPLPTATTEGWRRTDLRPITSRLHTVKPAPPRNDRHDAELDDLDTGLQEALDVRFPVGGLVIQQDSTTVHRTVADELEHQGVLFMDIHAAVREHPDLIRTYLMNIVPVGWQPGEPSNAGKFEALHGALWSGGVFIYVPPNTEVELPLRMLQWTGTPGVGSFPHTVVVVDRNSSVTCVEEVHSPTLPAPAPSLFTSGVTELYVEDNARLNFLSLHEQATEAHTFITQRCRLGRDAYVNWVVVGMGSAYTRATADVVLDGRGATAEMLGLGFGNGTQVFDFHTLQDHAAPNTDSDQLYKTAMQDRARLVYEGLVVIQPTASDSNGYQANRNLLLSKTAKADSIPMLEIKNNEVKCTHGSATGPVEPEHLYYLRTRGLPRDVAERLIIQGFFEPIVERVGVAALQDHLRQAIDRKIGGIERDTG